MSQDSNTMFGSSGLMDGLYWAPPPPGPTSRHRSSRGGGMGWGLIASLEVCCAAWLRRRWGSNTAPAKTIPIPKNQLAVFSMLASGTSSGDRSVARLEQERIQKAQRFVRDIVPRTAMRLNDRMFIPGPIESLI